MKIMLKNGIILLGLFLVFLMVGGCKKNTTHYPLSEEFREYFLFAHGSFWIYQNDSLSQTDSTYLQKVESYPEYPVYGGDKGSPTTEKYILEFHSAFQFFYNVNSDEGGNNWFVVSLSDSLKANAVAMLDYPASYDSAYYHNSYPNGYFRRWPFIPSMNVNSTLFNSVLKSTFRNDTTSFEFYFAKNVGLIKVSGFWNKKNQSWSLIRYHAVQ
jgi:hypothetical protein